MKRAGENQEIYATSKSSNEDNLLDEVDIRIAKDQIRRFNHQ